MKKSILTSIAAIAMAMPAIAANIPNDATCNSGVLGVSSGSANLEADYTANTINITWDGNGGSTPTGGASSCTYDSTFNLPVAPSRTGYTFAGWSVKTQSCFTNYVDDSGDWTDGSIASLEPGMWQVTSLSGNILTGISKCSSTNGTFATAGTPSDENGNYCWCAVSTYTPKDGMTCNISSPSWVFEKEGCVNNVCSCSDIVLDYSNFRLALFGI